MKLIVNVAQAYIENLPSTGSHRTARETLNRIAKIFSDGEKDMDTLDWGADVTLVSQMVGHSHVDRTASYDRRTDVHRRKAASLVDFNGD